MSARDDVTIADQVTRLYESIAGFHTTHMLEVGRELGIWTYLTEHPGATSDEIASAGDLNPFYTDVLCKTALSAGVLQRGAGGWEMAPHMDVLLGSPGTTFDLSRAARTHIMLADDYAEYAEAFRGGSDLTYQSHDATFMHEVAQSLRSLPSIFLEAVLPQLPHVATELARASSLLDIGCGAGWAAVILAERYERLEVTGVEVEPASVMLARDLVQTRGLTGRCRIVHGDASAFAADGGFDIATMFLVYHEIAPDRKDRVLQSVYDALRPGGTLVIFDEVYPGTDDELRTMPSRFTVLAQWYELIWGNVIDTRSAVLAACRGAGFEVVDELSYSRFHIFVARKP
jgi:SAM-dependent methyltransferase